MISLSECLKKLQNVYTNFVKFRNNNTVTNYTKQIITNDMNSPTGVLYNKIKKASFKNLPPKIGYFDETSVPVFAQFNMNIISGGMWCVSDFQGSQNLYYIAYPSPLRTSEAYMYHAYRMSSTSEFSYENEPVKINIDGTAYVVKGINGVGNDYMYVLIQQKDGTAQKRGFLKTYYSSNTDAWDFVEFDYTAYGISIINIIYTEEYNSHYIIGMKNGVLAGELIKYNGSSWYVAKHDDLYDWINVVISQNSELYNLYRDAGGASAIYNEELEKIIVTIRSYLQWNTTSGGREACYHLITMAFNAPKSYFNTGSGISANLFATTDYKRGNKACRAGGDSGPKYATYDKLDKKVYCCWQYQSSQNVDLFARAGNNDNITSHYFYENLLYRKNHVESTDTAPWAKLMNPPLVFNEEVFIYGYSKSYGWQYARVDYNVQNNTAQWKSGVWWLSGQHTDVPITATQISIYKNGNLQQTFVVRDGKPWLVTTENVTENGVTYRGVRHLADNGYPTPPNFGVSGVSVIGGPYYFPNQFIWIGKRHHEKVEDVAWCIVTYDISQKQWRTYADITDEMIAKARQSKEYCHYINIGYSSNFFKEGNNIFFHIHASALGGTFWGRTIKLDLNTGVFTNCGDSVLSGHYPDTYIQYGWNNRFGYYVCRSRSHVDTIQYIKSSKNQQNPSQQYNIDMFGLVNGSQFYTLTLPCAGSVGLVAYLQQTPLFLGGYFTIVPSQELSLYPNSTNYVWLERSQEDYTKVIVTVNKTAPTSSNYDGFYKIPIAVIGTDSEGPISTAYYHYENYKNRAV